MTIEPFHRYGQSRRTSAPVSPSVNVLDLILAFENGTASDVQFYELFGELIRTGQVWSLQGSYGRTAWDLIECGAISRDGVVDWSRLEDR